MKVAIGADHRGFFLKQKIMAHFKNVEFTDMGTDSDERADYPDFAKPVGEKVSRGLCERGILICSTGIGMSISANKVPGVRAAVIGDPQIAKLSREHNDSNVLCLAADFLKENQAFDIIKTWLDTSFEGGRHEKRLEKILKQEQDCLRKQK